MNLAYKYGPYRHNLHINRSRSKTDLKSGIKIPNEIAETSFSEDSKNELLREAFEKYQSFLKEDFEDRKGVKWSSAELNHPNEDGFEVSCHTRRFKSTVLSRKNIVFENTFVEDIANARKYCYQNKEGQKEYKLIQVKDDQSVVHYIQNVHDLTGRLDVVLEVSTRKMKNGAFLFIRDVEHPNFPVIHQVQRINYWFGAILQQESNNVRQISFELFDSITNNFFGFNADEVRADYQLLVKTMRQTQARKKLEVAQQYLISLTPIQRAYKYYQEYSGEDLEDSSLKWRPTTLCDTRRVGLRITAHARKMKNDCTLVRSKVIFVNADVHDIANSITTYFKNKESFKNHKELERNDDDSIIQYVRFESGIPFMHDREILMEATRKEIQDGIFVLNRSVEHPNCQSEPGAVRADYWYVAKLKKNGRNIIYESYQYLDCKHSWINDIDLNEHLDNYVVIVETMRKSQSQQHKRVILSTSGTSNDNNLLIDRSFLKYQEFNFEDLTDKNLRWSTTKLKNTKKKGYHITCHTRVIQDTILTRTQISFHETTVADVARVIPISVTKHSTLKKSTVLQENSDGSTVYYLLYGIPNLLIADREIILEIRKKQMLDGSVFICMRNVEHPDIPLVRKVVRGTYWCGTVLSQHNDIVSSLSFDYLDVKHKALNRFDASSSIADFDSFIKILRQDSAKILRLDSSP